MHERAANTGVGLGEQGKLLIQAGCLGDNLLHVAALALARPEVAGDLERHEQGGGRDDEDAAAQRLVRQAGVLLHRRHVRGLVRDEHQHHVEAALDHAGVGLGGELVHMPADGLHVLAQGGGAGVVVLPRLERAGVGRERHLRVDDEAAPLGQQNEHVGPQVRAVGQAHVRLRLVFLAAAQPRLFEHAGEDDLAPVALCLAVALERAGEAARLTADALGPLHEVADGRLERGAVLRPLHRGCLQGVVEGVQALVERVEQGVERILRLAAHRLALLAQGLVRE